MMIMEGKKYNITKANLAGHEWMGMQAKIVQANDPSQKGMQGRIVDEYQNMIVLETAKGEKKIAKKGTQIEVVLNSTEKAVLDLSMLTERSEDRTKVFYKKFYKKMSLVN